MDTIPVSAGWGHPTHAVALVPWPGRLCQEEPEESETEAPLHPWRSRRSTVALDQNAAAAVQWGSVGRESWLARGRWECGKPKSKPWLMLFLSRLGSSKQSLWMLHAIGFTTFWPSDLISISVLLRRARTAWELQIALHGAFPRDIFWQPEWPLLEVAFWAKDLRRKIYSTHLSLHWGCDIMTLPALRMK